MIAHRSLMLHWSRHEYIPYKEGHKKAQKAQKQFRTIFVPFVPFCG
jgi:hypothetical protein